MNLFLHFYSRNKWRNQLNLDLLKAKFCKFTKMFLPYNLTTVSVLHEMKLLWRGALLKPVEQVGP